MSEPTIEVRERGRRSGLLGCDAYFEVLAVRVNGLSKIEVFAIDETGKVIGEGHEYRSEGFAAGMIFEVTLNNVRPEYVAQWLVQASGHNKPPSVSHADALTTATLAREGAPIAYVNPPPDFAPDKRALPRLKSGYKGQVVTSTKSNTFHHPNCRAVRAFIPENRRTIASPQDAWDEGLIPCFTCLF